VEAECGLNGTLQWFLWQLPEWWQQPLQTQRKLNEESQLFWKNLLQRWPQQDAQQKKKSIR
jgi:hypothetical protein